MSKRFTGPACSLPGPLVGGPPPFSRRASLDNPRVSQGALPWRRTGRSPADRLQSRADERALLGAMRYGA